MSKFTFNGKQVEVQVAKSSAKQAIPLQMKKDVLAAIEAGMPAKQALTEACKAYGVQANKSMQEYPHSILHGWRLAVAAASAKK